jgi:type I restriction enzyme R subunit
MDNNDLKERDFEAYIEHWLLTEGGYTKGNQATYDKERAIDLKTMVKFLRLTQTKKWELYEKKYGVQTEDRLYNVLQDKIHERGLIWVLRNGIEDLGFKFKLVYFEPASPLNEELNLKYQQNIMECTRQFAYSTQNHNTIDMVLSVNGIPVVALELKNQLTGQNVENSRHQWMNDRDQREELFQFNHRILAYFGVDLYEAIMATELRGDKTFFMPFNQGSNGAGNVGGKGNPEAPEGKYTTCYLWERVLNRRMLLCILQRYISRQEEERISIYKTQDGKIRQDKRKSVKIIFPRYHQLDVVEKLLADTAEHGSGKNYLIQHSAGSGKSNSIAWVAYRLGALQNTELKPMFNCVFVITDRRILNSQLQNTILGFDHVDGTVETVKDSDSSTKLRDLINDDNSRIIICTLHRFPLIYNEIKEHAGKRYAIIVDEAHSSQTGKSAEKMKAALADTEEALKEMAALQDIAEEELEKKRDAIMDTLLAQGQHNNLSFYAFTATPKPKTLRTFGICTHQDIDPTKCRYEAFHTYSMLQAIEEGFIKDVLLSYTPYGVSYEITKRITEDPEYEETPATKAVKAFHDNHQHVIDKKCAIIVEKFREVTLPAMQGKAKAMVVTASRAHAVRYYLAIKAYCEQQGYTDVHPLVAFSGKVSYQEQEYIETQMNSTPDYKISEAGLPLFFASDLYNVLVVADKYQTGFDEPLLHTMFVDKKLRDVKAVQTLSRLNRAHPDKVDTYVLDFVNDPEDIKKSFEPFYTGTELIKPMDLNSVFTLRDNIRELNYWNDQDEQRVEDIVKTVKKDDPTRLGKLSNAFKGVVDRINQLNEETFYTVRGLIKQFVRFYNYLAQVERTYNRDLYRTYIFCDLLLKLIKTKPHERPDLNKQLMLVNSRIEAGETQSIHLDKNSGGLSTPKPGAGNGPDDKRDLLSNIIDKVNMMFRGNFTKEDRVLVESIYDKLNQPKVRRKLTKQAKNNDPKQFAESIFPEVFAEAAQECYGDQMEAFRRLFQNHDLYNSIMSQMGSMMYANFRAQDEAVFNPERFKQKIIPTLEREFAGFKMLPKPLPQVAEDLVTIIAAKTTDDIDGANDVIQNAFNRLYCSPVKVSFVDKKQHFNTLVSRFEVFLKKVYYLRNHTTIVSTKPGSEGQKATLADCIYQTPCLKRLKYSEDVNDKKFFDYLSKVRDWRNDNAHKAPTSSEQECDEAINILTSIYLYVVAFGIRSRELFLMATEVPMQTDSMPMAAEPPVEPDDEKKKNNMKCLSVQQPWASAICTGVKDVENRTWQTKNAPGRILIHASAKKVPKDFDAMNLDPEMISTMANLRLFGIMPEYEDMPLSAIIGYVDVTGFDSDNNNDSPWAGANCTHWHLENAYLFDEPIKDVKGKLGLFDYPIDENNLPPAHKVEQNFPVLEGEHLTFHVGDRAWQILQEDGTEFCVDINDPYTIGAICKEDSFELMPISEITFIHGDETMNRKVTNYAWDAFKDADGKDQTYQNEENGPEIPWIYAIYELAKE